MQIMMTSPSLMIYSTHNSSWIGISLSLSFSFSVSFVAPVPDSDVVELELDIGVDSEVTSASSELLSPWSSADAVGSGSAFFVTGLGALGAFLLINLSTCIADVHQ